LLIVSNIKQKNYNIGERMKGKVLLVLAIVGMFVIPMMPAKESGINYLEDAKNLLQNWENKLSTEGATIEEVKEIVQKMEMYKQILENEIKSKEDRKLSAEEIVEGVYLILQLEARIELEKYFLKECEKAREEYRKGNIKFNFETLEILSTSSTVYPTGGWKKWERTTGEGGIYAADYNVNEKKGYAFSRSDDYNSGYGESGLYWETWWGGVPVHWQVQYSTHYFGYSSGHVTIIEPGIPLGTNAGSTEITYFAWDVYNGIKVKEVKFGGYIADSNSMEYHSAYLYPVTDFWIGNNPLEKWEIGVYFDAYTFAWGLADMEINHYLPSMNMCWQLNSIQITTL